MPTSPVRETDVDVLVIGAGPAGLALAAILMQNSIKATIFERESAHRDQGGSLDLSPEYGQAALKEADCFEDFKRLSRPESDVRKVVKKDGTVLWNGNIGEKDARIIPEGMKFGNKLQACSRRRSCRTPASISDHQVSSQI